MKGELLQTMEEIFVFKRPVNAYQEMYSMDLANARKWKYRFGVVPSIIFSFIVVFFLGLLFHTINSAVDSKTSSVDWRSVTHLALGIETARAAEPKVALRDEAYAAKYVAQSMSDPIAIEAGETKTIEFTFKNIGTTTWKENGSRFISAYTVEPRYRNSVFHGPNWLSKKQTAKIEGTVAPQQVGTLTLSFTAPDTTGDYVERFYLAAENYTWLKGGYFFFKATVIPKQFVEKKPEVETIKPSAGIFDEENIIAQNFEDNEVPLVYKSKRIGLNKKQVLAKGSERIKIIVIYQNKGTAPWEQYRLVASQPGSLALVSDSQEQTFADVSWKSPSVVLSKQKIIDPEESIRETFYFRAPRKPGSYTVNFYLQADGNTMHEATADIQVNVTAHAPDHYIEPQFTSNETVTIYRFDNEPRIRVGLRRIEGPQIDDTLEVVSHDDDYFVFDGNTQVGLLPRGETGTLAYSQGVYTFTSNGVGMQTNDFIRLEPKMNEHAVFALKNYERYISWKGPRNFNTYRGSLEYRMTEDNEALYVVNDLLMEDYVAGIAENSNSSPEEYLKAQSVAQRSYAYYVKAYSDKHKKRNFDVVAHTGDQLYLGQASEEVLPRFVEAARSSRGYMVSYDNNVVITPYFARTGGTTRSWTEAWGGQEKPWLQPVRTTYDARDGVTLRGHGVGMSQRDAAIRADEEKLDFVDLLKYYYTGVEVEKMYE